MIPPPPRSTLFPYTTLFRSFPPWHGTLLHALGHKAASNGSGSRPRLAQPEIGRAHVELQSPVHLVCRLLLEKKNSRTSALPSIRKCQCFSGTLTAQSPRAAY